MELPTLDGLLKKVGITSELLDQTCSDDHLVRISNFLPYWRRITPYLGLSGSEICHIEIRDRYTSEKMKVLMTLQLWKEKYGYLATYQKLVIALLEIGNAYHAEQVCRFLKPQVDVLTDTHEGTPSSEKEVINTDPSSPAIAGKVQVLKESMIQQNLNTTLITRRKVDRYECGCSIPSCQFQVKQTKKHQKAELHHRVKLQGAKESFNFMVIESDSLSNTQKGTPSSEKEAINTDPPQARGYSSPATAEKVLKKNGRPSLVILKNFPGKSCKFNIVEQIGTNYNTFGTHLLRDDDGNKVSAIERTRQLNSALICKDTVKEWLQGKGKQPVTYTTLVDCLRDAQLNTLASDIEDVLQWFTR